MKKFLDYLKKGGKKAYPRVKRVARVFFRVIRLLGKALAGAVTFAFMAELAPGLRESLPNFFEIVDFMLAILEELCGEIISHL